MLSRLFIRIAVVVLFVTCFGATQILAQEAKPAGIGKAVHWSDAESGTEIYLFHKANQTYRLAVISKRDLQVSYHTSINSIEPVDKVLAPIESLGGVIRYYEFDHYFSKMTIWLGLEFTLDGKRIPRLTRTFHDDIFTLVPERFFGGQRKDKP